LEGALNRADDKVRWLLDEGEPKNVVECSALSKTFHAAVKEGDPHTRKPSFLATEYTLNATIPDTWNRASWPKRKTQNNKSQRVPSSAVNISSSALSLSENRKQWVNTIPSVLIFPLPNLKNKQKIAFLSNGERQSLLPVRKFDWTSRYPFLILQGLFII
jgi:hypothetical protein